MAAQKQVLSGAGAATLLGQIAVVQPAPLPCLPAWPPLRQAHASCVCSRTTGSPSQAGLRASATSHMMSTKNSQGFPMAFWKDWRLPVNSGGTAASSRTGGPPGGPPTTV